MTNIESIRTLLGNMKTCPDVSIGKYFSEVMKLFPYLARIEKIEVAQAFHHWAENNSQDEPLKLAYSEFLLGAAHHLADEHEAGLRFLNRARKCFDELNETEGQGICATLAGSTFRTLGNFELSLKTSWEGYNLLKQNDNYPLMLAAAINTVAYLNLELHNYDEAQKFFHIGIKHSEKTNDYYFRTYALHGLGKVNMLLKKNEEAKKFFEQALQLAEETKNAVPIGNSVSELANFYLQTDELDKSEQLNKRALAIREENNFKGAAITSCINLGEVLIKKEKWDEAEQVLYKGLTMAEEIKVKPKIYRIHFLLSEIYKSRKLFEKSLFHYQLFHKVHDQVEEEDFARKLADSRMIFEAEQTKKENIIIKKQKEEIEKKNYELQETIDELTLTRVSRKAKALTLGLAVVLFIFEDPIIGFSLGLLKSENYFLEMAIKITVIFSLSPFNRVIEKQLLKRVIKKKKEQHEEIKEVIA